MSNQLQSYSTTGRVDTARRMGNKSQNNLGFTLIELLVGLSLGVFIIGVAFLYFVSSAQTFRVQTNESLIQENARFALEILTQNLRLAGLNPSNDVTLAQNLGTGLDIMNSFCTADEQGLADGATGANQCTVDNLNGNPNASDRISVSYILEADEGVALAVRGCNNALIEVPVGQRARLSNILWTAVSPGAPAGGAARSLYCQTYDLDANQALGTALPIIDGVDAIQFQYGVDSVNDDGIVDIYQPITAVANPRNIKMIRVAMLINSGLAIAEDSDTEGIRDTEDAANVNGRTYNLLDAPGVVFNDRKLRQIFSTTVLLPNTI